MKSLNTEQSDGEPELRSKKQPIETTGDLEIMQNSSWSSNQEFKRSKDFMKIPKSISKKQTKELSAQEEQESIVTLKKYFRK